jgi:hypothetical protein
MAVVNTYCSIASSTPAGCYPAGSFNSWNSQLLSLRRKARADLPTRLLSLSVGFQTCQSELEVLSVVHRWHFLCGGHMDCNYSRRTQLTKSSKKHTTPSRDTFMLVKCHGASRNMANNMLHASSWRSTNGSFVLQSSSESRSERPVGD